VSGQATESTRVQLCGRLSVEFGGIQRADGLRGRQTRLLVAYLLLNRSRHVGREELIGALWPERAPLAEDAALRTLLSRVRSALGGAVLSGREELILALPEPVWVDLEAAASELERALLALAHGDARGAWGIAQVPLNIAGRGLLPGERADWLEPHRRELEEIRLRALEVIGAAGLRLGGVQLGSVERSSRALIASDPYRESGYTLLMQALAARGNAAEAMRVFDQLRRLLRDELGATPSAEALAIYDRLLGAEPPGRAARPDGGRLAAVELPAELRARSEARMVGRERELAELTRVWERASAAVASRDGGAPARIACLAGEPGIGKSRLVAELARRAHDSGAVVLCGRAPPEALIPYHPFLEALRHYVAAAPLPALRADVPEFAGELARLLPELRRRVPDIEAAREEEPEIERYRLFEAVVGLLARIAGRAPVLLVLDDLHWADRPSLLLLRHLARAAEPGRLLTVVCYRNQATEPAALGDLLLELRRDGVTAQIELGGLSEPEIAELVLARAGQAPSQALVRELHRATEGNPLFVAEILRHLLGAGVRPGTATASDLHRVGLPQEVTEVIALRLAQLSAQTLDWLRVAAVIGREFDPGLVEALLRLDEPRFLAALEEALEAGLLVESAREPGRYAFAHALIRETLYDGMSSQRRARIHGRVAEALEKGGEPAPLGALAYHFTRAGRRADAGRAIDYAVRAAEEASAILAHEEAAEHYAQALDLLTRYAPQNHERRCELLLRLGEAKTRAGEGALARAAFDEAAALADQLGDAGRLARAAIGAARPYVQPPGVVDTALIGMLERALERMGQDPPLERPGRAAAQRSWRERSLARIRLLTRLCGALYYSSARERMAELCAEAEALAERLGEPEARAHAYAARRRALWDPSHLRQRLEVSTQMLRWARAAGSIELSLHAHAWLVVDLFEAGDRAGVEAQIEAFAQDAERVRQPLYLWQVGVWRAMQALFAGRLREAEQLAAQALAGGAPGEQVTAAQYHAIQLMAIRREQARLGELEGAARQMIAANPARPGWRAALAMLLAENGRSREAHDAFEPLAAEGLERIPRDVDWLTTVILLGEACAELGDVPRARILHEMLLPYREVNVVVGVAVVCLGPAARVLGRLAALAGQPDRARQHFERALAVCGQLGSPLLLAQAQLDYAQALGAELPASRLIDEAQRTAEALGLNKLARQAARLRER